MGRSPSPLSMTRKQLEEHLGQRLFETERKNRLTPLGKQVFELAQQGRAPTIRQATGSGYVHNPLRGLIGTLAFKRAVQDAPVTIHNTLSLIAMLRRGSRMTVLHEAVTRLVPGDLRFRPVQGLEDRRQVVLYLREEARYQALADEFCEITLSWRDAEIPPASMASLPKPSS